MDHSAHHHGAMPTHDMLSTSQTMKHAMTFHFGKMETILFDFWMPDSDGGMFLSCIAVMVMCFIMETIRWLRQYRTVQNSLSREVITEQRLRFSPQFSLNNVFDALLHFFQLFLNYCLMLVFMTFNFWLCLAVVFGEVISRLIFTVLFPYLDHPTSSC